MICFNGPRPEDDGTYTARTKYGLISVIIHEVGHFYYPMIINSDERQWTWMDEGLNTFTQYLAESEWQDDYPSRRGEPYKIVPYMTSRSQVPIMTNSESLHQFGANAYGKPATALNILRETILGRELFDHAFRTYGQRWWFKRPEPADFFRTMEDASGADLAWFWRGWFLEPAALDLAVLDVEQEGTGPGIIVLDSIGDMAMPVPLRVIYSDASVEEFTLPVQIWHSTTRWNAGIETGGRRIDSVTIDPKKILPDLDRGNNRWDR